MSATLEGKTVVVVVPAEAISPATDTPLGGAAKLDPGELRRHLMQGGSVSVEGGQGTSAGPHFHHHPHPGTASYPNLAGQPRLDPNDPSHHFQPLPRHAGPEAAIPISPQVPRQAADQSAEVVPNARKKEAQTPTDSAPSKEKQETSEKPAQAAKGQDQKEEKPTTDPKATTETKGELRTSEKVGPGIDQKVEPSMPDRSTPIGDLLKPDRIRDLIAGTRTISSHHRSAIDNSLQPNQTPANSPDLNPRYENRPDSQRIIQQVIVNETILQRTTPLSIEPRTANSFQGSSTQNTSTATTMAELRTSTLDKLTQMKSALEISVERAIPHLASEQSRTTQSAPQGAGIFSYVEPVRHQAVPTLSVQIEDRTASSQGDARSRAEKGNVVLDGLAQITKKVASIETLRALDRNFENACLAMFAAAALGVMATDRVLRELLALAREAEQRLREEQPDRESKASELEGMRDAVRQLEDELAEQKMNAEAGLVADITGVVADATIGRPLAGVRIDAGALGFVETNAWGEFHIRNIPLGTEFRLVPSLLGYSFDPDVIFSAVGVTNYFNIGGVERQDH